MQSITEEQKIREDQRRHAANQERRLSAVRNKGNSKIVPKGHEAFLKALESSGAHVEFEKASNGEKVIGTIKASDKYTVSVFELSSGKTRVLFKHDISEFSATGRKSDTAEV